MIDESGFFMKVVFTRSGWKTDRRRCRVVDKVDASARNDNDEFVCGSSW